MSRMIPAAKRRRRPFHLALPKSENKYSDTHNLTVGLPLEGKWELGGYPAFIDKQLIDPQLTQYNVLGHHFRFNKGKLDEFMPLDTK